MRYRLPRQVFSSEMCQMVTRKARRERFSPATRKNLEQMAQVVREIEERGCPSSFVCKKLPDKLGYGIFLHPRASKICRGQVIAPYSGELSIIAQHVPDNGDYAFAPVENFRLTRKEQKEWDPKRAYRPGRIYALKLDALKRGNFTRFINHSARPNVEALTVAVPENKWGLEPSPVEILYIAKRDIHPGEQLLTCYDDQEKCYWGVCGIEPFPMTPKTFRIDSRLRLYTS